MWNHGVNVNKEGSFILSCELLCFIGSLRPYKGDRTTLSLIMPLMNDDASILQYRPGLPKSFNPTYFSEADLIVVSLGCPQAPAGSWAPA